ncbi:MAG TPA: ABC transporter permease [Thermoanaerobaculia bacterium]|nr:ABC transporter permease [Thermoanaerobaculia bacterium]
MIRHLLKLTWNRKRTNALIILEIFFSFLVVFGVVTMGVFLWNNYRSPLGFSWQNVWNVQVVLQNREEEVDPRHAETFARLLEEVRSMPAVEAAAGSELPPYLNGAWIGTWDFKGIGPVEMEIDNVTAGLDKVLGLNLVEGRGFEKGDEALAWDPVVIDQDLARAVYGGESPVGKQFGNPDPKETPRRVIGVVSDYRKAGELSANTNFMFQLNRLRESDRPPGNILIRVRPGTTARFEETLVARLHALAPQASFEIKPMEEMRAANFRERLAPLAVGGIVAFFLLLMVGLGLIGVLWQNLLQRTRELGLRRATGASRSSIQTQLVLEQLLLTSFGVLLGTVLVLQIPILDLIGFVSEGVFAAGLIVSMIVIFLLALLCAVHPSQMASRVPPAEALRYE